MIPAATDKQTLINILKDMHDNPDSWTERRNREHVNRLFQTV